MARVTGGRVCSAFGVAVFAGGVFGLGGVASTQAVPFDVFENEAAPVALERGPVPSDWSNFQVGRDGRPVLQPVGTELLFGDQRYEVHARSGVLEPGRYDRLPATGGAVRLVSGSYHVQTLNMVGASFDVDTSAGNVWLEVQDAAVPVSSVGVYTHRADTGAELILGPGASGSIFADSGSVVRVTAGEYAFDSIVLAEGARFIADESEGDVVLSVRGALVAESSVQLEFVGGAAFLIESRDGLGQPPSQRPDVTGRGGSSAGGGGGGGRGGGGAPNPFDDLIDDLLNDDDDDDIEPDTEDPLPDGDDRVVPTPGTAVVGLLGLAAGLRRRR